MVFGADHWLRSLANESGATTDFTPETLAKQSHLPENEAVGLIAVNSNLLPIRSLSIGLCGTGQSLEAGTGLPAACIPEQSLSSCTFGRE